MSTFIKTAPEISEKNGVKFQTSDVESLMDHHDLDEDARNIIRTENLLPTTFFLGYIIIIHSIPY